MGGDSTLSESHCVYDIRVILLLLIGLIRAALLF